uniref:DUF1618 domain-containing protein n=1 Tax=Oryza glumipatula TaxID=40148 RepID=A0A0D9YKW6_9ORYZ
MHGSPRWWWVLEAVNLAASTSRLGKWTSAIRHRDATSSLSHRSIALSSAIRHCDAATPTTAIPLPSAGVTNVVDLLRASARADLSRPHRPDGRSPICSASVDLSHPHRHRRPPLPISSVPKDRVKLLTSLWGNYSIPKDNPYTDDSDLELEVWALGLRNPWRCSFDSARPSYFYCADKTNVVVSDSGIQHMREDLGDWVSDKTDGRAEGPCWLLSSSQRTTTGVGKNAQKDFAFSCDTFFPTVLSSIFSNLPSPIFLLPGEASSRLTDGISCHGEVTASSTRRRVEERDKAASGIDLVPKFPTQPLSIDLKVNIVHGRSMTGAVATGNSALDLAPGPCCG